MTGRHYQWHKNWTLDAISRTAAHVSGIRVRYEPATEENRSDFVCDDGVERWFITCVYPVTEAEAALWAKEQAVSGVYGEVALSQRFTRLMREAGNLWIYHQKKRRYDEKKA